MNKRRNLKNVISAFIGQLVVLGLSLFVPRFVLTGYGSDTNGLLSTVGQIIAYMTLLEAGIGQAARNELYRYVKDDVFDKENSSSVMTLSRKVYRNTTKIYALLILVLAVVLPFIIKTDLSYLTVFLVILIEGASSVISFYFVQNYTNILIVDGKQYVNANIDLVFKGLVYAIKIVMALLGVNIVLMEIGFFIATLVKIFIYEKYVKKHYGWIDYNANIEGKKLNNCPNSVSLRTTEIILEQMKNTTYKIFIKDVFKGTGFFCKIPFNDSLLSILMTCNVIIIESILNQEKNISVFLNG